MGVNNKILDKDLDNNNWLGIVINNNDPDYSGRCKIRVFSLMDDIEDDFIPWFTPITGSVFSSNGAGNISIPKIGTLVRVTFSGSDIYAGEYTAIQNVDSDLIEEIKNDYQGTHVLLYDSSQELLVIFQPNSGFKIYYKESYFQITPDNMITLQHASNKANIQILEDSITVAANTNIDIASNNININSDITNISSSQITSIGNGSSTTHAVSAEPLITLLQLMANAIDAKTPSSPGTCRSLVDSLKPAIINSNLIYKT